MAVGRAARAAGQGRAGACANFENTVARLLCLADVRGREEVDLVCQVVEQVESPACLIRSLTPILTCAHTWDFAVWWAGASDALARGLASARGGGGEEEQQVAALEGARWRCTARLEIFQLVT